MQASKRREENEKDLKERKRGKKRERTREKSE